MDPPVARPVLLLCAALLLAGCTGPPAGDRAGGESLGGAQTSYVLRSELHPPTTNYTVVHRVTSIGLVSDFNVTARDLSYTWTNTNLCGTFTKAGPVAVWDHGDNTNCHERTGPGLHPGIITVVVGGLPNQTASTGYMTCEFKGGSDSGDSPPCFVSSVSQPGGPQARPTSLTETPGPGVALGLAAALGAAVLLRRRRGR